MSASPEPLPGEQSSPPSAGQPPAVSLVLPLSTAPLVVVVGSIEVAVSLSPLLLALVLLSLDSLPAVSLVPVPGAVVPIDALLANELLLPLSPALHPAVAEAITRSARASGRIELRS
ncbi:MAG TPA: hypothetical protein VG755_03105 [Nannocystaceae bacterium]|nr:hypothetical protein [Nannocystaceae bacterium]